MLRVAVDIGGTFTDLVAQDELGRVAVAKVLTTPLDHSEGVMNAIAKAGADPRDTALFLHGSTIAINTVIERKGVKTALITTRGFRDVYEIGRSNRPDAYNLFFERPVPLVPRSLRREVTERMTARGEIHTPLNRAEATAVVAELKNSGVQSIAVCLLHSYANPAHEEALGEIIASVYPEAYLTLSHRVLREYREYERTSTTAVNAYVGPVVARYLGSLREHLRRQGFSGEVLVMQSGGGVMSLPTAVQMPVRMMESGPVAGVIGAAKVASALGHPQAISFDMGGTTAKVSLTRNGNAEISNHYYIGGYNTGHPVMLPVVDIVEVGSGGGSIAWLDGAGGLKVGPVSSGALPGPACYGLGGTKPTVTDANLILGRLAEESFLGGEMRLDRTAATAAVQKHVAGPLEMDVNQAAVAIVRIANAHMALALRAVSVERGQDPRDFCLVASGGAGPLHGCTLARELKIPLVIIPRLPGQFSAWGMLACDLRQDYVQTMLRDYATVMPEEIQSALTELLNAGLAALGDGGNANVTASAIDCRLDLRYRGQEYTVAVPLAGTSFTGADREPVGARFHELHQLLYGHAAPEEALELVGLRVTVHRDIEKASSFAADANFGLDAHPTAAAQPQRKVYMGERHGFLDTPVCRRADLSPGAKLDGPAIIEEPASTTVVLPYDHVEVARTGELVIEIAREEE
ncbi:MAG: hydantoinase/oxoprolinase family protein [Deltaproteobacteria bacterium]|nr:hydantoinase/oxoprolinase family protein [Deltaproteobacteria bacterium]